MSRSCGSPQVTACGMSWNPRVPWETAGAARDKEPPGRRVDDPSGAGVVWPQVRHTAARRRTRREQPRRAFRDPVRRLRASVVVLLRVLRLGPDADAGDELRDG